MSGNYFKALLLALLVSYTSAGSESDEYEYVGDEPSNPSEFPAGFSNTTDESSEVAGTGDIGEPEINIDEVQIEHPGIAEPASAEVMDLDTLKEAYYTFANSTKDALNFSSLSDQLTQLNTNIQLAEIKLDKTIGKERAKSNQLRVMSEKVSTLQRQFTQLEQHIQGLDDGIEDAGRTNLPGSSGGQTSWATLYRSRGHSGRTTELDFRSCNRFEDCCKNLSDLDNDTQSIHTHDTCVTMFKGRDCTEESVDYYPGSSSSHSDLGRFNDAFSSGKPCNRS